MIKMFLLKESNSERDSFIWNMTGSLLMAFQSVIMLMVLTRVLGLQEAGIFTIAYANANLFLTIGKYGMRNFQVSDVSNQFSFGEYRSSRVITSIAMFVVFVIYVLYAGYQNAYSMQKSSVIICMCILKVVDAAEDIYHGMYQQKGRLDIAGKALTIRLFFTIFIFCAGLIIVKNLLSVLVFTTVFTILLFILLTRWSYDKLKTDIVLNRQVIKVVALLRTCLPLFIGSFLAFYIGNAPKYAIDRVLSDELQACYGFIAMPVFVIGLLNTFIFNPIIFKVSMLWKAKKIGTFIKIIAKQVLIIIGITLICILGAYLIGIPVLSILYNTDLSAYKTELIVLLLGGGFLALSGLLTTTITIIRFQKSLLWGYVIVALLAYLLSPRMVEKYFMMGAAILYLMLMIMLCVIFILLLCVGLARERKRV